MSGTQKHKSYNDERITKAIKELDEYRAILRRIRVLKDQKVRMEENYSGLRAVDYEKPRVQGGAIKNELVETALKWAELDVKIANEIVEKERIQFTIEGKIHSLPFEEQQVIALYFINCKTVDAIALLMNCSERCVRNIKKRALLHYAEVGV